MLIKPGGSFAIRKSLDRRHCYCIVMACPDVEPKHGQPSDSYSHYYHDPDMEKNFLHVF